MNELTANSSILLPDPFICVCLPVFYISLLIFYIPHLFIELQKCKSSIQADVHGNSHPTPFPSEAPLGTLSAPQQNIQCMGNEEQCSALLHLTGDSTRHNTEEHLSPANMSTKTADRSGLNVLVLICGDKWISHRGSSSPETQKYINTLQLVGYNELKNELYCIWKHFQIPHFLKAQLRPTFCSG